MRKYKPSILAQPLGPPRVLQPLHDHFVYTATPVDDRHKTAITGQ